MWNPFRPKQEEKQKRIDKVLNQSSGQSEAANQSQEEVLFSSMEENGRRFEELFKDNDTIICRKIQNAFYPWLEYRLYYSDGMVSSSLLHDGVLRPLIESREKPGRDLAESLSKQILTTSDVQISEKWKDVCDGVTYGDAILFLPHSSRALILSAKNFQLRGVDEPEAERVLSGPREGFNESLLNNLTLIRRRLRTHDLKLKFRTFGRRTQTKACICYLDSLVNKNILKLLEDRLNHIDIDGVLDTNYLSELVRDSNLSPFRSTGYTERPDVVAAKLLEGRIAIFLDGTPVALTVPYLFIENFQSSEDYYLNFFYTSFSRMLRILGFFMTITVPGFYIAIVAFHHEMLPTPLLINIASERTGVPLPAAAEAFIMLIVFDILRETGVRMPSNVGQALSIVGALVIGQAAVEARLVAAPMIIIVGITGITALLVPRMSAPIIFVRIFILIGASIFGLFGMMLTLCALFIHMLNLDSFGVSQLTPSGRLQFQEIKDMAIRAPWWTMIQRPRKTAWGTVRQKTPPRMKE